MADPRANPKKAGSNAVYATYKIDDSTITFDATQKGGSAQVGLAAGLLTSDDDVVELVADGQAVEGKIIAVHANDTCTLQVGGYCELPGGDSATLTIAAGIVGDLGAASAKGYIRAAEAIGASYDQTEQEEQSKKRGAIVDNSTTTAVLVRL